LKRKCWSNIYRIKTQGEEALMARFAFVFAALTLVFVALFTILGALGFPGYSHTAQFMSELGARGAPQEMLIRFAGFLPAGVLMILFVIVAFASLSRSALTTAGLIGMAVYAIGYIVAAFFPCDPGCRPAQPSASQTIHNFFGLIGYVLAPLTLAALGWSARQWPGGKYLSWSAYIAAMLALFGMMTLSPKSPYVGLSQRLIEGAVLIWVVMCAWYVRSHLQRSKV
jgi:Protein of unknown function (DUF998)